MCGGIEFAGGQMIPNHRFVIEIALLFLLTAQSASGQQRELRKVHLNVFRVDAATAAARGNGYFAAERIDVDATPTPSSTAQMSGLSQGKFDIISTGFDNVLAWSGKEGAAIIAVAQVRDKRSFRFLSGRRSKIGAISKARSLRPTPPTRLLRSCYDEFCSRMAWIWQKAITSLLLSVRRAIAWNP